MFLSLAVLASLFVAVRAAIGPSANLYVVNALVSPDGFSRSAVLATENQTHPSLPGVLIQANKGDRMNINVVDMLTDTTMMTATSIHWHGIYQKGSSWADGPVGLNQCPITPGHSFAYSFGLSDQAGTFWYHSHLSTQYCDGLRGPLVIYDPQDPFLQMYDIDDESTVISLSDWYHIVSTSIVDRAIPDATLINGLGRYLNGTATALSVINVVSGKRYRFRIINMACDPNYIFSIDGHDMTIIEVDGVNHQPLTVDSLQIFAGQRYSVIVTANQPVGNYWVRALPNTGQTTFDGGLNSAIFRYQGAEIRDPTTTSTAAKPMNEIDLHPLNNPGAPGGSGPADVSLVLNVARVNGRFTINGESFTPPNVPVLLQIMSGARSAQELLPNGCVYTLPTNKTIEIAIPGGSTGSPHPFHLHGHTFDVVRSAGSSSYNYANPVRRDVVSTGDLGDNTTIRFTTNNAGPWFLHCHIDWHLDNGLAIVFAEDVPAIADSSPPAEWRDLCPEYKSMG